MIYKIVRFILLALIFILFLMLLQSCVTPNHYCPTYKSHSYDTYSKHVRTWKQPNKFVKLKQKQNKQRR